MFDEEMRILFGMVIEIERGEAEDLKREMVVSKNSCNGKN